MGGGYWYIPVINDGIFQVLTHVQVLVWESPSKSTGTFSLVQCHRIKLGISGSHRKIWAWVCTLLVWGYSEPSLCSQRENNQPQRDCAWRFQSDGWHCTQHCSSVLPKKAVIITRDLNQYVWNRVCGLRLLIYIDRFGGNQELLGDPLQVMEMDCARMDVGVVSKMIAKTD